VRLDGLHHVTAITADVTTNLDFYGRLLGLRLVWQGVNADNPEMRHIAYGDELGNPGSIVTFFDMPGIAPGRAGVGMIHRFLLRVADDWALDFWERRLAAAGVASKRTKDRLVFSDPEGLGLELVIDDREDEPLTAAARGFDEQLAIRGLHAVRVYVDNASDESAVLGDVLAMAPEGDSCWLARGEHRHGLVTYEGAPNRRGVMGAGTLHHVAFTIRDGDERAWHERTAAAKLRPTAVLDQLMFKSIYFRAPSGVLFELATSKPGFVFESPEHLGESLVLIGDLESRRQELERRFPLLPNPRSV
jgi:glyoxalase family protein